MNGAPRPPSLLARLGIPAALTVVTVLVVTVLVVTVLVVTTAAGAASPLTNRLSQHASPYLRAHADDPVAWQEWNAAALARARAENKPLFVSIGYYACYWCHVMQQESYRHPGVAAMLNQHFIPVKVDRELDTALDAEMLAFARDTLGRAGWPLNVFITPAGFPFFAVLYLDTPTMLGVLHEIAGRWQKAGTAIATWSRTRSSPPPPPAFVEPDARRAIDLRQRFVREALDRADELKGGFRDGRKVPAAPQLAALLALQQRYPDPRLGDWLRLTFEQMAAGGLRDHVGGGFFRYTVDPDWRTPHFEKMLYDNAQLAGLYLLAARVLGRPEFRLVAFETLDFLLAEMRDGPTGAFASSTSAMDVQGREGGVYLWQAEELKRLLPPHEYAVARRVWGLDQPAEAELGHLPQHVREPGATEAKLLPAIHARLRSVRSKRTLLRDEKLLAGVNGLMLVALSEAAATAPRYRRPARALRDFLMQRLWVDNGLRQGLSQGRLLGDADLEGHVYAAAGLIRHARLGGDRDAAERGKRLLRAAWQRFHGDHGFRLERQSLLARPYNQPAIADGPTPSASALLIDLSQQSDDGELRRQARDALGRGLVQDGLFHHASLMLALDRFTSLAAMR